MSAPASDIYRSAASRPLRLRARSDLIAQRQRIGDRENWVVKDPLAMKYFRFRPEEYAILEMLDGRASLESVQQRFQRRFAPQQASTADLQQFIGSLHGMGLLLSDEPEQGPRLLHRKAKHRRQRILQQLTNPLYFRFRGIDPTWLLDRIYPAVRWAFSPFVLLFGLLLGLAALSLVIVQYGTFRSRLPAFDEFFSLENALWFAAAIGGSKVLHELGHALTCRHFGGRCQGIGVLFLVFTPCLYCDVSDSWMLPSKWRRMAIAAAGMAVEWALAAVCTFIWWFGEPGLLNHLCLHLMFVCSVSTLMFNANPLMKYDGYYMLADFWETPTGRRLGRGAASGQWCLGLGCRPTTFARSGGLFAAYAVAAVVYRWFVTFTILCS